MKFKVIFVLLVLIVILFLVFLVKGNVKPQDTSHKPQVSTSFYPLYFFTDRVGGDLIEVYNITPAGTEPHDYEPSAGDIIKIQNSRLLILLGQLEPWGGKIKDQLADKMTQVIEVGSNAEDPHIWLSPLLAKNINSQITASLVALDPSNAQKYQQNSASLDFDLDKLDTEFQNGLKNCQTRNIITAHEAFDHLAQAYELNQVSIAGLSPDVEPSLQRLAEITNFAKANNVKYIFFESLVSPKLADTIAKEVGAQTLVLNPIEGLTDEDVAEGKDYFTEMRENLVNLRLALQCQ